MCKERWHKNNHGRGFGKFGRMHINVKHKIDSMTQRDSERKHIAKEYLYDFRFNEISGWNY